MKLPRVLVFTVTYEGKDYCLDTFLDHAKKINYPGVRHIFIDNSKTDWYYRKLLELGLDAHRTSRGNNSREAIARAQNLARKIAIDEGYDYILSLESDIMVPPNIVQLLLSHSLEVTSALYFIGDPKEKMRVPCLTLPDYKKEFGFFGTRLLTIEEFDDYLHKGLKRVQAAGMGCCLISHRVFKRIPFMYEIGLRGHSDIYFFNDCFRLGIPVFVDTNIVLDHQNVNWSTVADR
jgi:GT2 family glycosyltransferase